MRIDSKDGIRGKLYDLDLGKEILKPIWFDQDKGLFSAYQVDDRGNVKRDRDGAALVYTGAGRIHFILNDEKAYLKQIPELVPDAPVLARYNRVKVPIFSDRCSRKGCQRIATWAVSDEVETPYEMSDGIAYSRSVVVNRRFYCSIHWKPPRILDHKGEVVEELENVKVRPV